MGTKYQKEFKKEAVSMLLQLNSGDIVSIDDRPIINVRQLCIALGISTYSLYNWKKEFEWEDSFEPKQKIEIVEHYKNSGKTEKSFKENWDIVKSKDLTINSEIRFWGFIASVLRIKNYNQMSPSQLQLKVGLALIKRSGLVDMDKAIRVLNGGK